MVYRRMNPGRTFRDKCPDQVEVYIDVVMRGVSTSAVGRQEKHTAQELKRYSAKLGGKLVSKRRGWKMHRKRTWGSRATMSIMQASDTILNEGCY